MAVHRIVYGGVETATVDEGMQTTAGLVGANDLARIIDARGVRSTPQRIVQSGVGVVIGVVDEAVLAHCIHKNPNDHAGRIDATRDSVARGGRRIV